MANDTIIKSAARSPGKKGPDHTLQVKKRELTESRIRYQLAQEEAKRWQEQRRALKEHVDALAAEVDKLAGEKVPL